MAVDSNGHVAVEFKVTGREHRGILPRLVQLLEYAAGNEAIGGELGVWLCTDEEIADLHQRYMGIAGPTDVITFPGDDPDSGGHLGDIAVSVDTAREQARDAGHPPGREIAYLCLHGLLHLAGYDDVDEDARYRMHRYQEDLIVEFERRCPGSWEERIQH
jgi:probable rRNA maturation factor